MTFTIQIAGIPIEICHRYPYIRNLCRAYITDCPPVFSVSVTEAQIQEESLNLPGAYPQEICEATCIHREIVRGLVKYDVLLIHSAVIAVDGTAYVFMAKSGVGKSTHIRLWQQVFGDRAVVVNGDKPLFSFVDGRLMAHGNPWNGKEHLGQPVSLPVGAMCLLERGQENRIVRATEGEVVGKLFHQVLLPTRLEEQKQFMEMMNRILREIPFYRLRCNMEKEAAVVAYEGMRGAQV